MQQSPLRRGLAAALLLLLAAPSFALTGGPDAFGYTFADSAAPGGPTFAGIDITATGTPLVGGDDVSVTVTLARPFNFYGTALSDLSVVTNGFLCSTNNGGGDFSNDCPLPTVPSTGTGSRMYALHDDLVVATMFHQYFASCPRPAERGAGPIGCTIVEWANADHLAGGVDSFDVWAYLYDNNDFVYEYGPGNPEMGSGSTTGIQNATATDGLTVVCNTAATVPASYAVAFTFPCDRAVAGLAPPTTSLVLNAATVINADLGTISGMPSPAYRGNGIFSFIDIAVNAAGNLTFQGGTAPELRASGNITLSGAVNLNGTAGGGSGNGVPGAAAVAGVAGGGFGARGGCRVDWQNIFGQRGGGSTGGFGGTHPIGGGAGFDDATGGGGGGNGTAGADSAPPFSGTAQRGQGGCASTGILAMPLRGGGGGGGGGCDQDDPNPGPPGGNDGGAGGGSGGGAIRLSAGGNITVFATGVINANGANGGTSGGNGGSGGGGAGGTILLVAGGAITHGGTFTATGGAGGLVGQPGSTSAGGAGGVGFIAMFDSDGVIAGAGTANPMATTGTSPAFQSNDLTITNLVLPNASNTQPYAATVTASGGSGAYTFMVTVGALPAGLMLDSGTGALTGMSTAGQGIVSEFTITVDDGSGTADRAFCIETKQQSLAIATQSLPPADLGSAYNQTINLVGSPGAPTFELVTGALPTGLMLNAMTGAITGNTGMTQESATFSVVARQNFNQADTMTYSIEVGAVASVLPGVSFEECAPVSRRLVPGLGTAPFTFEVMGGGPPPGVTFDPLTGIFGGTPDPGTLAGSPFAMCLFVYDAAGFLATAELSMAVTPVAAASSCSLLVSPLGNQMQCRLPGLAIPDSSPVGIFDTLSISGDGIIQEMTVQLQIDHTWVGDLVVRLTHVPSGVNILLLDRPGTPPGPAGCDQSNIDCVFDDLAVFRPVEAVCDPSPLAIGGTVAPTDLLRSFRGLNMLGDWELNVHDDNAMDVGTLVEWCLDIDFIPIQGAVVAVDMTLDSGCDPAVDVTAIDFSTDGGMTFAPATPAAGSPVVPPQVGVLATDTFLWDALADGVATMMIESSVLVRVSFTGTQGAAVCNTVIFVVDNRCQCGDCDLNLVSPTILDALEAAQISAGLFAPTALQTRCCDTTGTGGLTIVDALLMAQAAAGLPVVLMCP